MNEGREPGSRPARMEKENKSTNLTVESDNIKGNKSNILTDLLGKIISILKSLLN